MKRFWTTTEARRLHELRSQHVPTQLIAAELNRTEDAIYAFLRYVPATRDADHTTRPIDRLPALGRKRNRWLPEEITELRLLADSDLTPREAADRICRTYRAVIKKAADEGIVWACNHKCSSEPRFDPATMRYIKATEISSRRLRDAILAMAA